MGPPQLAGLRELWELMGGYNSAGTQTLLRCMAIQLGEREQSGWVRLDQVWNIPTAEAQQTAMDMAITKFRRDLRVTSREWVEKAKRLRGQVQKAQAQNQEFYHKRHARKERSPSADSTEIAEVAPGEKGKQVVGKRESKRAKAEVVETPEVETPPDFMEVNPKAWQENKQREGTYRYNYSAWKDVKPPHNPWLVRGNMAGLYMAQGPLWVRVPQVVETCRKVYGGTASSSKIQAFELYVPLPGGKVHKCPSMKAMWVLCYAVETSAMFTAAEAAERGDLARLWQNEPRARVADTKKAVAMLDQAAQGAETLPVDIFGPIEDVTATPSPSPSRSPAPTPTPVRTPAPQPQAEARRGAAAVIPTPSVRPVQDRRVSVNPEFPTAYAVQEPPSEVEGGETSVSVSVPALSGPEHAAAHPSVTHITDTLVRMGYLDDLQKGIFMLRDPLGDEAVGRRNKVAKHIKNRKDAEEAMLVLCREGKMELVGNHLFRVLHFEEDEEPAGRTRSSPDTSDSQPPKKKPKQTQAKPKVRRSVNSEPAQSANLYDANNPKLRALLARLPASQVGNWETGVHKAPRIDNSGPNPACLINGKVFPVILLDYGSESVITGRAGARQMGLKPSMMDLGAVALRVADGGTTKAFDRTKQPVEFVFNPKTPDETMVLSHVIVVNSENADTLLGMSVLGKIGLTANPYKGRVKYYVNWKEPNARKAYLKSTFPVDRPSPAFAASSSGQVIEVVNAASAWFSFQFLWTAPETGLRQQVHSSVCVHIVANSPRSSLV
jgi:hypothetical protein